MIYIYIYSIFQGSGGFCSLFAAGVASRRSARQLPASSEGMDASPVVRILPWPKPRLFQGWESMGRSGGPSKAEQGT